MLFPKRLITIESVGDFARLEDGIGEQIRFPGIFFDGDTNRSSRKRKIADVAKIRRGTAAIANDPQYAFC
jgi:hypothetical protein